MTVAHDAAAAPVQKRGVADNPLVRAVGRVPLPLGAKLLIGFALVGALLALVAVLGLVALGQSNSRGAELRRLQQQGGYEQLLLTDAKQLEQVIAYPLKHPEEYAYSRKYKLGFLSALDQQVGNEFDRLCLDSGAGDCLANGTSLPHLPLTLGAVAPSLLRKLETVDLTAYGFPIPPPVEPARCIETHSLFFCIAASSGTPQGPVHPLRVRAVRWAASFARELAQLTSKTKARASVLVAADRSSFSGSRDFLIGAGVGSLLLALALGLLLASSVVAPLRRTESRLDEMAVGDFAGRLEVANRDEIGSLAAKVNRTSDELQRVHRELELASEHKSQFVTNMSHELRTPLNAIIGFSDVLHEQMFGELNDRQLAYVDDIRDAGKHQLSLINELLDLAKIEAGRMDLKLSQVAIPEVLRAAVSMHAERASRGGIELSVATEPEEITITADELRVRQVVFNLLSNAVKFTPPQGRIDVSARLDNGNAEVAVADTGPGLSAEDIETIFEQFGQTTEGKHAEGTGLGLPLSRKLVELHGGRLWVESEPGHGSTFRFTLPVR